MSKKLSKETNIELARLTRLARENERLLARAILKIEDTTDSEKITSNGITEWEYDPNIKFEAPVK